MREQEGERGEEREGGRKDLKKLVTGYGSKSNFGKISVLYLKANIKCLASREYESITMNA